MNEFEYYKIALEAMSELYISMHVIDLKEQTYQTIKTNEHINRWAEGQETAQSALRAVMTNLATRESRRGILSFTNLSTLPDRMKGKKYISTVFRGKVNGWCNVRFIRLTEEEPLRYVMYVVENVDEQTRTFEEAKRSLEESAKLQAITDALMDEYTTVVSCDLEKDELEVYKLNGRIQKMMEGTMDNESYSALFKSYVQNGVYPGDQLDLLELLNIQNLKRRVRTENTFSKVYRNNLGVYGEVKVVRSEENTVLIGFVEKHDEVTEYRNQMYEDSLTHVRNRKFLDDVLIKEHCMGIAMADIDRFKEVNDQYGHQCGDEALAAVGAALMAGVRAQDTVARYGGDEFLIVFNDIPRESFEERLNALKDRISRIMMDRYPDLKLSMSFGGVYGPGTVGGLINNADKALNESKKPRDAETVIAQ